MRRQGRGAKPEKHRKAQEARCFNRLHRRFHCSVSGSNPISHYRVQMQRCGDGGSVPHVDAFLHAPRRGKNSPLLLDKQVRQLRAPDAVHDSKERRVNRWEHEAVIEAMLKRLDSSDAMIVRRRTVEHTFGTIKAWMGHTYFLARGLVRVKAEMSLCPGLQQQTNDLDRGRPAAPRGSSSVRPRDPWPQLCGDQRTDRTLFCTTTARGNRCSAL